ncbi:MAG TPA: PKD domain-containing protein, partial [Candidatus Thermoplasmatota archaeon]|nr:PKD domain-containing protein [Candidatus Thermoplasmatota archaeon]
IITKNPKPIPSRGIWLYVGGSGLGNYTRIQDAIDNASNGDTVFVYDDSSPYFEYVNINKMITLVGEDKNTTVIDGSNKFSVIKTSVDGIVLTGFTIQNSKSEGIVIQSNGNQILDNIVKNIGEGMIPGSGIYLGEYSNNVIRNNEIIYNNGFGIEISADEDAYNNLFTNNFIAHNLGVGIFDNNREVGTIATWNVIADNGDSDYAWHWGIYKHFSYSIYHHNDFLFNYEHVDLSMNGHGNTWDDGSAGNFWDDWEQNPGYPNTYIIMNASPWNPDEIDYHPSAIPYSDRPVVGLSPKHYYALIDEPIYFIANTSVELDSVSWYWEFGDGTTSDEACPIHSYNSSGFYRINVTITDNKSRSDTSYSDIRIGIAPNIPTITGPTTVKVGVLNNYKIVTTDPDGDDVYYIVHYMEFWGEMPFITEYTIGPYKSGEEAVTEITWKTRGDNILYVKAKDDAGLESDWGTLDVTIPKIYSFNSLFLHLLERFPNAFPILRYMIGCYE